MQLSENINYNYETTAYLVYLMLAVAEPASPLPSLRTNVLRRLAHDRSGNTLAIVAAGAPPSLGIIGGGVVSDAATSPRPTCKMRAIQVCTQRANASARERWLP